MIELLTGPEDPETEDEDEGTEGPVEESDD